MSVIDTLMDYCEQRYKKRHNERHRRLAGTVILEGLTSESDQRIRIRRALISPNDGLGWERVIGKKTNSSRQLMTDLSRIPLSRLLINYHQ
jgi:hypothetical protein